MNIDIPSSYPSSSASAGKPVDVQTLQQTFAAVWRTYGADKSSSQTNTLLEIVSTASENSTDDRHQLRREQQQQAHRQDFSQADRKQLDQSEIRHHELASAYQDRRDRSESLRTDYQTKAERNDMRTADRVSPINRSEAGRPSPDTIAGGSRYDSQEMPSNQVSSGSSGVAVAGQTSSSPLSSTPVEALPPSVSSSPAFRADSAGFSTSHVPISPAAVNMVSVPVPQSVPQPFTIFTPAGRLGQQEESGEEKEGNEERKEKESEEREEKPKKPKGVFAVFESIRESSATFSPRTSSRRVHHDVPHDVPDILQRMKSASGEPENNRPDVRPVSSLDAVLNSPGHDIAVQKKNEERPNQTQIINRIAAACEAAAIYAPIRIKINLDHLGTLTLRFFYKADKLSLRFETPSPESATFLRNNLDGLKTIMSKRNVKIMDIEIKQQQKEIHETASYSTSHAAYQK